jgi:hypothetical protein
MNIKLKKVKKQLYVRATIPPALKGNPTDVINTEDVLAWLKENHPSYQIEKTKVDGIAHNGGNKKGRTGTWVFILKGAPKTATRPAPTRNRKRAKTPPTGKTRNSAEG